MFGTIFLKLILLNIRINMISLLLCLVLRKKLKKKNTKENNFLMFDFTMKNTKEKQIKI